MNHTYHIFGLNISSAIPLPAPSAIPAQLDAAPDVVVEYGQTPAALADPRFKGARFQAGPGEFLLRVDGVARYYVKDARCITIMPEDRAHDDDILIFLMGSVMGALLHQRNILTLHAGAISVNGQSVLFCGPSGVGKSTLAAGFHQRGYPFLSDDVCAVATANEHPAVIPGFPRLKLWADALKKLNADKKELQGVRWSKGLEKYFLPVDGLQSAPVPIKSVFVLQSVNADKMELTALKGAEKIDPLIDNTYRLRFLKGLGGKKDHFKQCAAVAASAEVYRVVRPRKGFLLTELMELLEERFAS